NRRTGHPLFYRLTFCLLGVATPVDLIRDTRVSPFNVGRRIELRDFTREEAAPLAEGLKASVESLASSVKGKRAGSQRSKRVPAQRAIAQRLLQRVLYWTSGNPYLTQRLCRALAEA